MERKLKVCSRKTSKFNFTIKEKDKFYKKLFDFFSVIDFEISLEKDFILDNEMLFLEKKNSIFLSEVLLYSALYIKKAYPLGGFGLCVQKFSNLSLIQGLWEYEIANKGYTRKQYDLFKKFKNTLLSYMDRKNQNFNITKARFLIPCELVQKGKVKEKLTRKYLKRHSSKNEKLLFDTGEMCEKDAVELLNLVHDNPISVIGINGDNLSFFEKFGSHLKDKIDCIYIDPPYNTGSRSFAYKDDISSYTWVNNIANRMLHFKELLKPSGSVWVSIDDAECHRLKVVAEKVFGWKNFVSDIIWEKKYTRSNDTQWFSQTHEHLVVYAKDKLNYRPNRLERTPEQLKKYSNPDNDPRGPWKSTPIHARSGSDKAFAFKFKSGRNWSPPPGTFPRFSMETMKKMEEENRFWFGKSGNGVPRKKSFLSEVNQGVVSTTLWGYEEVGHTHEASTELKSTFPQNPFLSPKPLRLMERVFQLNKANGCLLLDCYAGSGTTGIMTLIENSKANQEQSHCILIESGDYFDEILVTRHKKALSHKNGVQKGKEWVEIKPQIVLFLETSKKQEFESEMLGSAFQNCLEQGKEIYKVSNILGALHRKSELKSA